MRSFHIHIRFTIGSMAVWLGILFLTAAGMGFFLSNSRHRAAKPAIATLIGDQAKPSLPGSESDTPDSTPDLAKHVANGDMHVHRTGLRSADLAALPFPPLPTRFSPVPLPEPDQHVEVVRRDRLPMPPVPSKLPPGPMPEQAGGDLTGDRSD